MKKVQVVRSDATVFEACKILDENNISGIFVVDPVTSQVVTCFSASDVVPLFSHEMLNSLMTVIELVFVSRMDSSLFHNGRAFAATVMLHANEKILTALTKFAAIGMHRMIIVQENPLQSQSCRSPTSSTARPESEYIGVVSMKDLVAGVLKYCYECNATK